MRRRNPTPWLWLVAVWLAVIVRAPHGAAEPAAYTASQAVLNAQQWLRKAQRQAKELPGPRGREARDRLEAAANELVEAQGLLTGGGE